MSAGPEIPTQCRGEQAEGLAERHSSQHPHRFTSRGKLPGVPHSGGRVPLSAKFRKIRTSRFGKEEALAPQDGYSGVPVS